MKTLGIARGCVFMSASSLVLALSFACSSEEEPKQTPGSGGTAGNAGNAGSSGSAGSAGSAGDGGTAGAAGSAGSAGAAGSDGGIEAGTEGGMPQGKKFVPEGITVEYVGQGPSGGLELIAFTLLQQYGSFDEPAFLVAVKNSGPDPICMVDVPTDFLDATGTKLGSTPGAGALSAPVHRTFNTLAPCLDTGDIGMGLATLNLGSLDVSQVRKIQHGFLGNIDPNATKVTGVVIQNVQFAPSATGTSVRATGTVVNGSTSAIADPVVDIYAVDPAGRPYGLLDDLERIDIPVGGSWNFQSLLFTGEVSAHVDYVDFNLP